VRFHWSCSTNGRQGRADEYPVTTLLALEAVQAAKLQSLQASELLDMQLRAAFFVSSRCISMRSWIERVAESCPLLDVTALLKALDEGLARRDVMEQWHVAENDAVKGSPHLFLPDGTDAHNPGIEMHWEGEHGAGFPVITKDDPSVFDELLRRAAG
jgi:predicted DsbA family dithiol-disulfide isomerase